MQLYKPQLAVFQIEFLLSAATRHGLPIKRAEGMVLIPVGNSDYAVHVRKKAFTLKNTIYNCLRPKQMPYKDKMMGFNSHVSNYF